MRKESVSKYLGVQEDVSRIIAKNLPDEFAYAMHEEAKELSEENKQLLLNIARSLRSKNP